MYVRAYVWCMCEHVRVERVCACVVRAAWSAKPKAVRAYVAYNFRCVLLCMGRRHLPDVFSYLSPKIRTNLYFVRAAKKVHGSHAYLTKRAKI